MTTSSIEATAQESLRVSERVVVMLFAIAILGFPLLAQESRNAETRNSVKAVALQWRPDPTQVMVESVNDAIQRSMLPWRIVILPYCIEMVLLPPCTALIPFGETDGRPFVNRDVLVTIEYPIYVSRFEINNRTARSAHPATIAEQSSWANAATGKWGVGVLGTAWDEPMTAASCLDEGVATTICRTIGGRLPSEAEWLVMYWLGRGLDRVDDPSSRAAAMIGNCIEVETARRLNWEDTIGLDSDDGSVGVTCGGRYPPNAIGIYDMDGNVGEWTHPRIPEKWYRTYLWARPDPPWPASIGLSSGESNDSAGVRGARKPREGILSGTSWMQRNDMIHVMTARHLSMPGWDPKHKVVEAGVRLVVDVRNLEFQVDSSSKSVPTAESRSTR